VSIIIPKVPVDYDSHAMKKLTGAISDPTRARIYFETLLCGKLTAKYLMERMTISRSSLSHHLTKLVDEGILNFQIETEGRPHKVYFVKEEFENQVLEPSGDPPEDWLLHRLRQLEGRIMELQTFVSIATNNLNRIKEVIAVRDNSGVEPETFVNALKKTHSIQAVHILTEREATIWVKMYLKFLKELESNLQTGGDHRYVSFSGILPLVIAEEEPNPTF
jgi:DNA-binding transcriptional ArsR family regulator